MRRFVIASLRVGMLSPVKVVLPYRQSAIMSERPFCATRRRRRRRISLSLLKLRRATYKQSTSEKMTHPVLVNSLRA